MRPDLCCGRRHLLRMGLGGSLGLLLADGLLRGAAAQEPGASATADACIVLWMSGGMSQTDTFDPKPGTPSAGPLGALRTAQKDLLLSELLPLTAEHMRHVSLIRSMATREGAHDRATYLVHTGWAPSGTVRHPDVGALVAQALAPSSPGEDELPPYVCIGGQGVGPGLLGVASAPFTVADPTRPVQDLVYPAGVDAERFARRRRLLEAVERQFRRDHPGDETEGHTTVYVKADRLMHSRNMRAFDLSQETARVRAAYGPEAFGQGCLMARRLVEAGVKAVEVQLGGWDTHQDNFTQGRRVGAQLDRGLAALLGDLRERDLLRRTLVLVATEFGRTPAVNKDDGRDHFATGWSVALAGGPVRGGRAIGATTADGQQVAERPVTAADLMATIAHALGIDRTRVNTTPEGRPIQVVDPAGRVVDELFAA